MSTRDAPTLNPSHEKLSMNQQNTVIHPTAKIAEDVQIGPWTHIGANVEIGSGTRIDSHVVINEGTIIGKNNRIMSFTALGGEPQHLDYKGEPTQLIIGNNNIFRENVTVSRGTESGGGVTSIGNYCYFMAYSHAGHDCHVKDHVIMVNGASLSGHVIVDDYAIIGGFCCVHQHVSIGAHSFSSHACMATKDILPFVMMCGNEAKGYGLNLVGLRRRGFNNETIRHLQEAYRLIFRKGLPVKELLEDLEPMVKECPEIQLLIDGIKRAKRGFLR